MCPICECTSALPFPIQNRRPLQVCSACRHIWWTETPTLEYLAAYYQKQYTGTHQQDTIQAEARQYYRGHAADLLQRVRMKAGDCTIVDYGCSYPVFLQEAKKSGYRRTVGVDYAEEAFATSGEGVEMMRPDQMARLADGSVDIARFSHTLEHLIDPVAVLREVVAKVRPGGLVYITQPSFPFFQLGRQPVELKDSVYPEHLHFFSPLSLATMVEKCGCGIDTFFTHTGEENRVAEYAGVLDEIYSMSAMAGYKDRGDKHFPLGTYPRYLGENSSLYARRG